MTTPENKQPETSGVSSSTVLDAPVIRITKILIVISMLWNMLVHEEELRTSNELNLACVLCFC